MEENAENAVAMDEEAEDPYGDFLILDRIYDKGKVPHYYTLMDSASFSDYEVDFNFNKTQEEYAFEYFVSIEGIPEKFPSACSNDKKNAWSLASEKALQILSRHCYTVKYKNHPEPVTLEYIFEKGEVMVTLSASQSSSFPAPEEEEFNPSPGDLVPEEAFSNIAIHDGHVNDSQVIMPSREQDCHQGIEMDMSWPKTQFGGTSSENRDDMQMRPPHDNLGSMRMPSFNPSNKISSAYVLPDTFGSKMMKMMGWKGGGLGRDGCGITEPVKSSLVQGRFGFGHTKRKEIEASDLSFINAKGRKISKRKQKKLKLQLARVQPAVSLRKICDDKFKSGVHAILQEFCKNSKHRELIFSTKLSPLQRKTVHDIAPEYSLSSISFGHAGTRHLVLFRDHSTYDYLEKLQDLAKEDKKIPFEIIPPSLVES